MQYEFDPVKSDSNADKHGMPLTDAEDFEWETAVVKEDARKSYAEPRFLATGYVGQRLHVMVFCMRAECIRVISLRQANRREERIYANT